MANKQQPPKWMREQRRWLVHSSVGKNKKSFSPLPEQPRAHVPVYKPANRETQAKCDFKRNKKTGEYYRAGKGLGTHRLTPWRYNWNQEGLWVTYDEAVEYCNEHPGYRPTFVVYVKGDTAERDFFVVLDADDCFDEKGELLPAVRAMFDQLDALGVNLYVERSRSGTGLHGVLRTTGVPFSNDDIRINETCVVQVLTSNALNITGDIFEDYDSSQGNGEIPYEAVTSLEGFTLKPATADRAGSDCDYGWDLELEPLGEEHQQLIDMIVEKFEHRDAGENRSVVLMAVAGMVARAGYTGWTAYQLIEKYPTDPPLTEEEITRLVEKAHRDAMNDGSFGGGLCPEFSADGIAAPGIKQRRREPKLVRFSDIEPQPLKWIWEGHIPQGCITLFNGRPGSGKSFVSLAVTKTVTSGGTFPDGSKCDNPGHVIWMSNEEPEAEVVRPRMDALGINTDKVHHLAMVDIYEGDEKKNEIPITLSDVDQIAAALDMLIARDEEVKMVVVDNLASFVRAPTRAEKEHIRSVLMPLIRLAAKYGIAIIIITHSRKELTIEADVMVAGDTQIVAAVRMTWHNHTDETDRERFEFLPAKCNLGKRPSGYSFRITARPDGSPNFEWEEKLENRHADDPLLEKSEKVSPKQIETAIDNIESALSDGPVQLIHLNKKVDESVSPSTRKRAMKQMKSEGRLRTYQEPNGTQVFVALSNPQTQESSDEQA